MFSAAALPRGDMESGACAYPDGRAAGIQTSRYDAGAGVILLGMALGVWPEVLNIPELEDGGSVAISPAHHPHPPPPEVVPVSTAAEVPDEKTCCPYKTGGGMVFDLFACRGRGSQRGMKLILHPCRLLVPRCGTLRSGLGRTNPLRIGRHCRRYRQTALQIEFSPIWLRNECALRWMFM